MKISDLRVDRKVEAEGEWIAFPTWPGVRFLVRGIQCDAFQAAKKRADLCRPRRDQNDQGKVYAENGELIATHLLLGWEGLDEQYDAEAAVGYLKDQELRELTSAILWCAQQASLPPSQRVVLPTEA